jgi:hypothetical protein
MSFIVPSGWNRHQGFPQITGSGQGVTLVDEFWSDYDLTAIYNVLPIRGSLYDQESVIPDLAELRLSEYKINPTANKERAIITLTYQPSDSQVSQNNGIEEYFLDNQTIELSLESARTPEQPKAYQTRWNYQLYEFVVGDGGPSTTPAWWETATDKSDATGELVEGAYLWSKSKPSGGYVEGGVTYDWNLVEDATKAGTEAFIVPSPIIQERKHYLSKRSASLAASTVGKVETPDETYGKTGGEWLVMSATLQRDGKRYLVEKSYQWSNEWDSDLYADA